jgi:hypothetical protein
MTKTELQRLKSKRVQVRAFDHIGVERQAEALFDSQRAKSGTVRLFPEGLSRRADEYRQVYLRVAKRYPSVTVVDLTPEQAEDYL